MGTILLNKLKKKTAIRNKRRGKEAEKRLLNKFTEIINPVYSRRTGIMGEEDAVVVLQNSKVISCECKSRKRLAFLKWWEQAKRSAEKKNAIPVVLVQQFNGKKSFVIIELNDLKEFLENFRR